MGIVPTAIESPVGTASSARGAAWDRIAHTRRTAAPHFHKPNKQ